MELRVWMKVLTRRWWVVAVPLFVVAAHFAVTYAPPEPVYATVLRYAAGTKPAALSLDYDRYYPWLTSEYVANGLADIAETGAFAQAVTSRLAARGLDTVAESVQAAIVTDNAQSILVVYLTWPDHDQSITVAEAVTAELTENSAGYFPQLEGLQPSVRLLDQPVPVQAAPPLTALLTGPAVRLCLALIVGVGLALILHYFDPVLRERSDVEALELPLVAEIPPSRGRHA